MAEKRREIQRNWKWSPGHAPNDDDAVKGSGWLYVDKVEVEKPPLGGPRITGQNGPPAGMKCAVVPSCQADMFVLQTFEPQEMLKHLEGIGGPVILPIVEDRVVVVACSNGHSCTWRESLLPARQRALGREV